MMRAFQLTVFLLAMSLGMNANAQETDFSSLDQDSNGKVSTDEFREYVEGRLAGFEFIDLFISRVDANDDNEISKEEFDGRMEHLEAIAEQAQNGELAPENQDKNSYSDLESEAIAAYEKIGELVDAGDWETISQSVTEEGGNEFCRNAVMLSYSISKMQLNGPVPMDALEETQAAIIEVMEEHGLDELEMQLNELRDNKEEGEEEPDASEKKATFTEKRNELIDSALDKDGKRWEITKAILDAQAGSPVARNMLNNNVIDAETDAETVLLTVAVKPSNGAQELRFLSPPTVIRMEKTGDNWLYAGIDIERSRQHARKFMQRRRRPQRGPEESEF